MQMRSVRNTLPTMSSETKTSAGGTGSRFHSATLSQRQQEVKSIGGSAHLFPAPMREFVQGKRAVAAVKMQMPKSEDHMFAAHGGLVLETHLGGYIRQEDHKCPCLVCLSKARVPSQTWVFALSRCIAFLRLFHMFQVYNAERSMR